MKLEDFDHLPDIEKRPFLRRVEFFERAIAIVPGVSEENEVDVYVYVAGLNKEKHVVMSREMMKGGRLKFPIAIDPQYINSYRTINQS